MARRGYGSVINVSAGNAFFPTPGSSVYAASKAFVNSFSESLAYELRGSGVRVMDNIASVLRAEAMTFDSIVKTTIFLTNLDDFQKVNETYGSYFKQDPPARSTVQVSALPKGANVEIEVIAVSDDTEQTAYDTSG